MQKEKSFEELPLTLSAEQTARVLGVSIPKVYQLMQREDFPLIDLGGRKIVLRDELEKWLLQEARRRKGTS